MVAKIAVAMWRKAAKKRTNEEEKKKKTTKNKNKRTEMDEWGRLGDDECEGEMRGERGG